MKRGWIIGILITSGIVICGCAVFSGMYVAGTLLAYAEDLESISANKASEPTPTPIVNRLPQNDELEVAGLDATETLKSLREMEVPPSDLRLLAQRLEGKQDIPISMDAGENSYDIGSQQVFWVSNVDTNENRQISTTLQYATEHAYFWIQDGIPFDLDALKKLVDEFENEIYPKNRQFFGSEWKPGIDGDPHLYIIFAKGLGGNLAGYFSSADEHHPLSHEYSNARESFVLSADNINLESEFAYAVLAHEFQHMIHWHQDRNEASWVNEGFSELAVFLNHYEVGSEYSYVINPDLQLNDWPNNGDTSPHYGASFMFFTYFLDRFGERATQDIVMESMNGLNGIDEVLRKNDIRDLFTNNLITAEDVFSDWVIATFINDGSVGDGRYAYHNFPGAPKPDATETIYECPTEFLTRDVHQFGVDYIRINCEGEYTLRFEGSSRVDVTPFYPHSGDYFFWSNKGDEGNMKLTKKFDFSSHNGPLTLSYYTWYDLEQDYDYLYLEVSEDAETWQIVETPSGTDADPSGNSYGWGYNGMSNSWVKESVDLTEWAGKEIFIRFEYVTDAAVHGEGMVLDDISIPEIGYSTDFEDGEDGWQGDGWLRMNNIIPQTYRLSLITFGDKIEVNPIHVQGDLSAEANLVIGGDIDSAVLVVSGTSRFSRQKAAYRMKIE